MRVWIMRLARAFGFGRQQTMQELLRTAAQLEDLVKVQLDASFQHKQLYRMRGSELNVRGRQRHLGAAANILAELDQVLARAREKLDEIERAMNLPLQRGQKPDPVDRQMMATVNQHLRRLQGRAQRLRAQIANEVETADCCC